MPDFLDDLVVGPLPLKQRFPDPFMPDSYLTENIALSRIGHAFTKLPPDSYHPTRYVVQDFLIDQTGHSGCNAKMRSTIKANFNAHTGYRVRLLNRGPRKVRVHVPANATVYWGCELRRMLTSPPPGGDYYDAYNAHIAFSDLSGPTPTVTYHNFGITHAGNLSLGFMMQGSVTQSFDFRSLTVHGNYPPRSLAPGLSNYRPLSYSLPYGLPGPNCVPYFLFGYTTTNDTDPGPFVTLS